MLGEYRELHWKVNAPDYVCLTRRRAFEFIYQVVVKLRPADADALAREFRLDQQRRKVYSPVSSEGRLCLWPELDRYAEPAGPSWLSKPYNVDGIARPYTLWLDSAHAVAVLEYGGD